MLAGSTFLTISVTIEELYAWAATAEPLWSNHLLSDRGQIAGTTVREYRFDSKKI